MADANSTPTIVDKVTSCLSCSTPVTYKTNNRVYCPPCRAERKRESARLTAERNRRKQGVGPVKNTSFICLDCGCDFVRMCVRTSRCGPCQQSHVLNKARAESARKCVERGAKKIGRNERCRHCGGDFVTNGSRHLYCAACQALQRINKLPHLKEWRDGYIKEWIEKNYKGARREEYQAMCRAYRARRKEKHGHAFTINERMSAGIRQSLKLGKGGWRWEKIVGYTLDELAFHLDRQFTKGMTWDEFMSGNIHIDHIVPKTVFQFESYEDPEFKQCWALSNLRPMWAKENIQKSARRMYLL